MASLIWLWGGTSKWCSSSRRNVAICNANTFSRLDVWMDYLPPSFSLHQSGAVNWKHIAAIVRSLTQIILQLNFNSLFAFLPDHIAIQRTIATSQLGSTQRVPACFLCVPVRVSLSLIWIFITHSTNHVASHTYHEDSCCLHDNKLLFMVTTERWSLPKNSIFFHFYVALLPFTFIVMV